MVKHAELAGSRGRGLINSDCREEPSFFTELLNNLVSEGD